MSEDDLEEQKFELLALKEILGEENVEIFLKSCDLQIEEMSSQINPRFFDQFETKEAKIGGKIFISPNLLEPLTIICGSEGFSTKFLPPICVEFCHPENYPSEICTEFRLSCEWLKENQIQLLYKKFNQVWKEENFSSVILFNWVSLIKDELCQILEIEQELNFDSEHGIIKNFIHQRGFGFIQKDSQDYFFHISSVLFDKNEIQPGLSVIFETEIGKNGKIHAVKVTKKEEKVPKIMQKLKEFHETAQKEEFDSQVYSCQVCFSEKSGKNCLRFAHCDHVFCQECMKNYFEVKIREGEMSNLTCPTPKCPTAALPTQVKSLVSEKSYQMYEQVLLSTTLESMADVVLCPRRHCQIPTIIDREASMGQCHNCGFVFCIYCKGTFINHVDTI